MMFTQEQIESESWENNWKTKRSALLCKRLALSIATHKKRKKNTEKGKLKEKEQQEERNTWFTIQAIVGERDRKKSGLG